jgi:hypothetical protein
MKNIIQWFVIGVSTFIITIGLFQIIDIKYNTEKRWEATHATLAQELFDERQDHLNNQIHCLKDLTYLITNILPPKEKTLETGLVTIQLSMGSLEEMKKEEQKLRDYVAALNKHTTAQFFVSGLENNIKIVNKNNSYFLVIEKLTVPWAVGICNFMWNAREYPRWARDPNHTCREMI